MTDEPLPSFWAEPGEHALPGGTWQRENLAGRMLVNEVNRIGREIENLERCGSPATRGLTTSYSGSSSLLLPDYVPFWETLALNFSTSITNLSWIPSEIVSIPSSAATEKVSFRPSTLSSFTFTVTVSPGGVAAV